MPQLTFETHASNLLYDLKVTWAAKKATGTDGGLETAALTCFPVNEGSTRKKGTKFEL